MASYPDSKSGGEGTVFGRANGSRSLSRVGARPGSLIGKGVASPMKLAGTTAIAKVLAVVTTLVVLSGCSRAEPFPEFPWPPPQASGIEVLPRDLLNVAAVTSLGDVNRRITAALDRNGYYESSYLAVPDGFALVTRLEQIESDGTPKMEPERWSIEAATGSFTLAEYLRRLFLGTPGYYRVIVFVVTPHPFSQSAARLTPEQANSWLVGGFNRLPDEVASLSYTDAFASTALIYEFARPTANDEPSLTYPGALTGRVHLERSGIWRELQP